jgi:hypothetical protein
MPNKWTPGPWDKIVHGERESRVGANTLLAIVYSTDFRDRENQEANARLIASAPDLYNALEKIVRFCELNGYVPGIRGLIEPARAALASARGETTEVRDAE